MSDEPGEASDTATPKECEVASPEGSAEAEEEFHPFDEVYDAYQPGPAKRTIGADGLAETLDTTSESDIPALSTESLVCMGDYSSFVLRTHWGEIIGTLLPEAVDRAPDGRWRVKKEKAIYAAKLQIERRRVELLALRNDTGGTVVRNGDSELGDLSILLSMMAAPGEPVIVDAWWVEVLPIRPQCRHYVRQKGTFHLNAAHKKYYRLCAARRTTEGTFMTLSDSGMYACDMREPHDVASAQLIEDFDQLKISQGARREHLPIFQSNGIFDAQKREET